MTESVFRLNGPLVVRSPNWLGDAVMALPAVRNLKSMLVNDPLTIAAPEKLAALWQACPFVDQVIALEKPKNLWTTARQLRAGKFGSAVLLPNSLRAAAEVTLAGIPQRVGYARGGRHLLLTKAVLVPPRNPLRLHQKFYYLDLIAALGGPDDASLPALRKDSAAASTSRLSPWLCVPAPNTAPPNVGPPKVFLPLRSTLPKSTTRKLSCWVRRVMRPAQMKSPKNYSRSKIAWVRRLSPNS